MQGSSQLIVERLHIGGKQPMAGWHIVNIQPGAHVDFVGSMTDLSRFPDDSITEVYASHCLEHLGYDRDVLIALKEIRRVLKLGGLLRLSVPDLDILCRLFIREDRDVADKIHIMRIMFGGRTDPYDAHLVGLNYEILAGFVTGAGFQTIHRVKEFGIFNDASSLKLFGVMISLNVEVKK